MRGLACAGFLVALVARADDAPLRPHSEPLHRPRFGVTGGVTVGYGEWVTNGLLATVSAGPRLRLSEHLGLRLQLGGDVGQVRVFSLTSGEILVPLVSVHTLVGLEIFSTSAFADVFVPELSLSLLAGFKTAINPPTAAMRPYPVQPSVVPLFGVQLQSVRLWASGWWLPLFVSFFATVSDKGVITAQYGAGIGI
jgi:hypothetical protein